MMQKLSRNQWAKAGTGSWWLSLANSSQNLLFYLFVLLLPTQLGKHFWPDFAYVLGQRVDYLSPTLYLTDILLVCLFLCVVVRKKLHVHPYFSYSILFFSLSIFFSSFSLVGWYWLCKFIEVSFLVWFIIHGSFNTFITGILLALGIIGESFLGFMQVSLDHSIGGMLYFLGERTFSQATPGIANASIQGQLVLRPYATFSHPNMFAGFLVVGMLLALFLLSQRARMFSLLVLITGTIGLALTLSRAAFATWVAVGVLTLLVTFKERLSKVVLFVSLLVAAIVLLIIVFSPTLFIRFTSFAFGQSLSEREILAKAAFTLFTTHPLLGVGPNNFIPELPGILKNMVILQPVHTTYLLIASELGLPGILLYVGFFFIICQKLLLKWVSVSTREKNHLLPLYLAIIAFLFLGLFDHYFLTLQQGQLLTGLVVGFALRQTRSSDTIQA